jgi:hypothetical protein
MTIHGNYIIQEREFIGTNIYKQGKSTQENTKRPGQYPKGSKLHLYLNTPDCHFVEKENLNLFKEKYIHRKDIGEEYFEGDLEEMISDMFKIRKKVIDEFENIKTMREEVSEKEIRLKELKKEEKILSLQEKILKTEQKVNDKKTILQSITMKQELHNINQDDDPFKEWFDKKCILDCYGRISLQKMAKECKMDKSKIKMRMKLMGYKYNRDITGFGTDENGKYYKGGFQGVRFV